MRRGDRLAHGQSSRAARGRQRDATPLIAVARLRAAAARLSCSFARTVATTASRARPRPSTSRDSASRTRASRRRPTAAASTPTSCSRTPGQPITDRGRMAGHRAPARACALRRDTPRRLAVVAPRAKAGAHVHDADPRSASARTRMRADTPVEVRGTAIARASCRRSARSSGTRKSNLHGAKIATVGGRAEDSLHDYGRDRPAPSDARHALPVARRRPALALDARVAAA